MSQLLTINDLLRAGLFHQAVARMQEACRVYDPTEEIDVEAIREDYEAARRRLKSVVPPAPFRVRVIYTNPVPPKGGAR